MIKKLYTLSHSMDLLKIIDNNGGRFTSKEHSHITQKEFGINVFKNKQSLLHHSMPKSLEKIADLKFLIDLIKIKESKNILSLGAGDCVLEYLLQKALPETMRVVATDFDTFYVEKAKEFFPDITTEYFDFLKDDLTELQSKLSIKFDIVVFFGSAYVMNNEEFINFFEGLKKEGVKTIVDFHAGYMTKKMFMRHTLSFFLDNPVIRKILGKPLIEYKGKFHGYSRNHSELTRLYKKAGLTIEKELSGSDHDYIAVLSCD